MRISVYLKNQDPLAQSASHEAARTFSARIVAGRDAISVGQNAIQLTSGADWATIKAKYRMITTRPEIPSLLPELPFYMPWVDLPRWLLDCYAD